MEKNLLVWTLRDTKLFLDYKKTVWNLQNNLTTASLISNLLVLQKNAKKHQKNLFLCVRQYSVSFFFYFMGFKGLKRQNVISTVPDILSLPFSLCMSQRSLNVRNFIVKILFDCSSPTFVPMCRLGTYFV